MPAVQAGILLLIYRALSTFPLPAPLTNLASEWMTFVSAAVDHF
jgi:hypothetical protein